MELESLLTSYLFRNKVCPLPTIGTLRVKEGSAISDPTEKIIHPPRPVITFDRHEQPADDLLEFIGQSRDIPADRASALLSDYCTRVRQLDPFSNISFSTAGNFFATDDGGIQFQAAPLPGSFFQPVRAERVIHPDASHSILVGDRETTSTVMSEYYSEDDVAKKSRWWIWPVLLFVVAIAMIIMYFNSPGHNESLGNSSKVVPEKSLKTYEAK